MEIYRLAAVAGITRRHAPGSAEVTDARGPTCQGRSRPPWRRALAVRGCLGLVASLIVMLVLAAPGGAQSNVLIPYLDTDWKYEVVPYDGEQGFESPLFDDSSFALGDAGFGTEDFTFGCSLYHAPYLNTSWAPSTDILLRKTFTLGPGANAVQVGVAIDDHVQVFVNGQDISGGFQSGSGCASHDQLVYVAPASVLQVGTNLLAVRGRDGGAPNYIDVQVTEVPPPANDDFANATLISSLPYTNSAETAVATLEFGEPNPTCAFGSLAGSVWYAFTPQTTGSVSATADAPFDHAVAAYTGETLTGLSEVGCVNFGNLLTFKATAGTTYFFQVGGIFGQSGPITFNLGAAAQPQPSFSFSPSDASIFDTVQFSDSSIDPAQVGFSSESWTFGDGASATGCCPSHSYGRDGDYTVGLTVTTYDGRTASTSNVVHIRTHDVAIAKFDVPTSASSGQTRPIKIGVSNRRYPETVQVDLYRLLPTGPQLIQSLTKPVPVLPTSKTSAFDFEYTFDYQDAVLGKTTFQAVATIIGVRDIQPSDNTKTSTPTKVYR
jgi:PKD domain